MQIKTEMCQFTGTWEFKENQYRRRSTDFVSCNQEDKGASQRSYRSSSQIDSASVTWKNGSATTAIEPDVTEVEVSDGVWTFKGYGRLTVK